MNNDLPFENVLDIVSNKVYNSAMNNIKEFRTLLLSFYSDNK